MASSARPGMGAIAYAGGVTFRVWAPFATAVNVAGSFNIWNAGAASLSPDGDSGYWSADIAGAASGDQYKFVISNPAVPQPLWKNDPYALNMTNSAGNSIVDSTEFHWTVTNFQLPPWNEMVIYELHVGSFMADPGSSNGRGDFNSVIGKLGYLADLGINVIQIMPSDDFPGTTSWGYNPADIFSIENDYGGPAGFQALIDAAHARGIAVIYDVVYNHLGPDDLDLWRFDGWGEGNYGGIYFYQDWRCQTPWGATRPDYGRSEVRQFLRDNALLWLRNYQCDGLRFDSTVNIRTANGTDLPDGWGLLRWINGEIQASQPWKLIIAEDMQDNEWLTKPLDGQGAGFGSQWGAGFVHLLRATVAATDDNSRSMTAIAGILGQRFNADAFQRVVYSESHDEDAGSNGGSRVPQMIDPGHADGFFAQKRSTLAAALVFTAPGIPMIFMGQEFLEAGAWSDGVFLDWSRTTRFGGILQLYRDLIHLRRNWFANTSGLRGQNVQVYHMNDSDKVIAFHRWESGAPKDDVVVIANFANRSYDAYDFGLPRAGVWRVRFNSDWGGYSPVFTNHPSFDISTSPQGADGMPVSGAVGIGPYTVLILSQDD